MLEFGPTAGWAHVARFGQSVQGGVKSDLAEPDDDSETRQQHELGAHVTRAAAQLFGSRLVPRGRAAQRRSDKRVDGSKSVASLARIRRRRKSRPEHSTRKTRPRCNTGRST